MRIFLSFNSRDTALAEAVRAGFKQACNDRDYATIFRVAERLPESVLQEDPDLLM